MSKILAGLIGTAIGFGAGFYVGYKITFKRITEEYEESLDKEIAVTKALLNEQYKRRVIDEDSGPSEETLERIINGLKYGPMNTPEETAASKEIVRKNIFLSRENEDDDRDYSEEEARRGPDKPYIISLDEYMEGRPGYSQVSLTYFVKDDTLIDETDQPLDGVDALVGETNLDQFGYRSKDPNVVYVRNESQGTDFEILRNEESYKKIVLGEVDEE